MTDQNLQQQLLQQLAGMAPQQTVPQATGWNQPATAAAGPAALIQGISVPVKIPLPDGSSVRSYLTLPAEIGQNPQMFINAVQALQQMGYPIDSYGGPQQGGGGWNNNGGNRGYGGGGYNRGGYGGGYRNGGGRW